MRRKTELSPLVGQENSSTKPSGLLALGLSWHVCSLGLDLPVTDLEILFLNYKPGGALVRSDPTDVLGLGDTTQARLEGHSQPKTDLKVNSQSD